MIRKPDSERRYHAARDRFLKPTITNFLVHELRYLGPVTAANVADELIRIFEENTPQKDRLKHGQMLWNALDKNTRADSKNRKYKTVVLSIVTDDDIALLEKNTSIIEVRKRMIARIINEAYQQEGILSTRDIALMLATSDSRISNLRIEFEKENNMVLPHTGVLHDMGSTLTHKKMIIFKHVVEKKPTNIVALETNHSQRAVDNYISDYNRVKTLTEENKSLEFIHMVTKIAKHVILQYQAIFYQYVKEL